MTQFARLLHGVSAVVAWTALALQLALLIGQFAAAGESVGAAIWRFIGFFTIFANVFVAVVATATTLAPGHRLAAPHIRYMALVTILLVGIVYSLLLRHIWSPQGWAAVADHGLHDVSPLVFLTAWLAAPHGGLRFRDAPWALLLPLFYLVYALIRGAFEGWYAYYFLDPTLQTMPQMLASIAAILVGVLLLSLAMIALDRTIARRSVA